MTTPNSNTVTGTIGYQPDGIRGQKMTLAFDTATDGSRVIGLPLCAEQIAYARLPEDQEVEVTFTKPVDLIGPNAGADDVEHIAVLQH